MISFIETPCRRASSCAARIRRGCIITFTAFFFSATSIRMSYSLLVV
jgi:hypothetical protein